MGRLTPYQQFYRPKMDKFLFALLGSDKLVEAWWASPNKAFELKTPEEVFDLDPDKVINYILTQAYR